MAIPAQRFKILDEDTNLPSSDFKNLSTNSETLNINRVTNLLNDLNNIDKTINSTLKNLLKGIFDFGDTGDAIDSITENVLNQLTSNGNVAILNKLIETIGLDNVKALLKSAISQNKNFYCIKDSKLKPSIYLDDINLGKKNLEAALLRGLSAGLEKICLDIKNSDPDSKIADVLKKRGSSETDVLKSITALEQQNIFTLFMTLYSDYIIFSNAPSNYNSSYDGLQEAKDYPNTYVYKENRNYKTLNGYQDPITNYTSTPLASLIKPAYNLYLPKTDSFERLLDSLSTGENLIENIKEFVFYDRKNLTLFLLYKNTYFYDSTGNPKYPYVNDMYRYIESNTSIKPLTIGEYMEILVHNYVPNVNSNINRYLSVVEYNSLLNNSTISANNAISYILYDYRRKYNLYHYKNETTNSQTGVSTPNFEFPPGYTYVSGINYRSIKDYRDSLRNYTGEPLNKFDYSIATGKAFERIKELADDTSLTQSKLEKEIVKAFYPGVYPESIIIDRELLLNGKPNGGTIVNILYNKFNIPSVGEYYQRGLRPGSGIGDRDINLAIEVINNPKTKNNGALMRMSYDYIYEKTFGATKKDTETKTNVETKNTLDKKQKCNYLLSILLKESTKFDFSDLREELNTDEEKSIYDKFIISINNAKNDKNLMNKSIDMSEYVSYQAEKLIPTFTPEEIEYIHKNKVLIDYGRTYGLTPGSLYLL